MSIKEQALDQVRKLLGAGAQDIELVGASVTLDSFADGFNLGKMGIDINTPPEEKARLIAEWKEKNSDGLIKICAFLIFLTTYFS